MSLDWSVYSITAFSAVSASDPRHGAEWHRDGEVFISACRFRNHDTCTLRDLASVTKVPRNAHVVCTPILVGPIASHRHRRISAVNADRGCQRRPNIDPLALVEN